MPLLKSVGNIDSNFKIYINNYQIYKKFFLLIDKLLKN